MASVSQTFRVTVTGPTFASTATIDDQFYTAGTAISPLTLPEATTEVSGTLRYALSARTDTVLGLVLPLGLTFTGNTRELSGTPTTAGVTELFLMATDANDNTSMPLTFSITVTSMVFASSVADQIYIVNEDIPNLTLPKAAADDGDGLPYIYTLTYEHESLSEAFHSELTFDSTTRVLSGHLTTYDIITIPLLYTAIGPKGGSLVFSVTGMEPIRPLFGSDPINNPIRIGNQTYTAGQAITPLVLPQATVESGTPRYVFDSRIPPGLIFNPTTRTLSGTPLGAADNVYDVLYCAYNENNHRSCIGRANLATDVRVPYSFQITIVPMPYFSQRVVEQTYPAGVAITPLTLPAANDGSGTLAYTLTSPNGGLLPAGLTFDATTRVLSGTPTAAFTDDLTYTATNLNTLAVASIMFRITVNAGPVFALAVANQGYLVGAWPSPPWRYRAPPPAAPAC